MLSEGEVLKQFEDAGALLRGHFILTSGRRSSIYMQCARVMVEPERAALLVGSLAEKLEPYEADMIVAPAMGGILVGYELARQRGIGSVFVERVHGQFELRRGFSIQPNDRVIIAEDVVTTGLSTKECIAVCEGYCASIVAVGCLIDRTGGGADLPVPLLSIAQLDLPTYAPDDVPPELASIEPTKPGSRTNG